MRKLITILAILAGATLSAFPVRADYVYESSRSCSYSSTEDCAGFELITETCYITYTNGTHATSTRTYTDPTQCNMCFVYYEPCPGHQ